MAKGELEFKNPQEEWVVNVTRLQLEAQRELEGLGWGPTWTPTGDQDTDHRVHHAAWLVASINRFFDAIENGDLWDAIRYAKDIGLYQGRREGPQFTGLAGIKSYARFQDDLIVEMRPDAERGRITLESASRGGKAIRRAPEDDQLQEEVLELHRRRPHLSWTRACGVVGEKYGLGDRQVRRRTKPVKWRLNED